MLVGKAKAPYFTFYNNKNMILLKHPAKRRQYFPLHPLNSNIFTRKLSFYA
jgi:hypothetical protein